MRKIATIAAIVPTPGMDEAGPAKVVPAPIKSGSSAAMLLTAWGMPLVLLILLNAPFWILQQSYLVIRPVFSVDLVIVAMVCVWKPRAGLVLLLLTWTLDAIVAAAYSYNFGTGFEFVRAFRFAGTIGLGHFITLSLAGALLLFIASAVLALRLARRTTRALPAILVWGALICTADVLNGSTLLFGLGQDQFSIRANVAGSPIWNLAAARDQNDKAASMPVVPAEAPLAFNAIGKWHAANPQRSILVVVVESMGVPVSARVQAWLDQRLLEPALQARWSLRRDEELFAGATTTGEMRVLCGLSGYYARLNAGNAAACLPAQLAGEGYLTTGMHGFTAHMFERDQWWPLIGLKERHFAEQLARPGQLCGDAFPGVCDKVLVAQATKQADQPKQFVYLLTLNTHLPLISKPIDRELALLCASESVGPAACQLTSQLGALLGDIAQSVAAMQSAPLVVVVGDHAPPFHRIEDRRSFKDKHTTLYVLTPGS